MELLELLQVLLGTFVVGDYIPWLDWVGYVSGLYGKTHKVNQEMDRFLEEVVEGHVNRSKETDDDDDFVDVLLSLQRSNAIGFPIDKTTIKAVILVRIILIFSYWHDLYHSSFMCFGVYFK